MVKLNSKRAKPVKMKMDATAVVITPKTPMVLKALASLIMAVALGVS